MPTEHVDENEDATTNDKSGDQTKEGSDKKDPASSGHLRDLAKERKRRQELEAELTDLKTKNLTEQERIVQERDTLKTTVQTLTNENTKYKLALQLKLPWSLAKRIQGDTEDEMRDDAKELLSNFEDKEAEKAKEKPTGGTGKKPPTNDGGKTGGSAPKDGNELLRKAFTLR